MEFKEYHCQGGMALRINPNVPAKESDFYKRKSEGVSWGDYYTHKFKEFYNWDCLQPIIHCPTELNGVYPISQFSTKWQFKFKSEWREASQNDYQRPYEQFAYMCKERGWEVRVFIEYIGKQKTEDDLTKDAPATDIDPEFIKALSQGVVLHFPETVAEVDAYEKLIGNIDINFPVEERPRDWENKIKENQPVKITFGIQPKHLERIEEERQRWFNEINPDGRLTDAIYIEYFWEKMGKEFGWAPFTLALSYFKHLKKSEQ